MAINKPYTTQYSNIVKTPQKGSTEYTQTEKDAAKEYLDRLNAIDTRIKQVQALRQADAAGIRRNQELAQRDINDQMFREYLQSRERMGSRGVANSGLMADAQIRLNANKQDRLAELYGQSQDKLSEVNRMYAPQQTELITERGGVRQSKIFQEMFDKMMDRRAREAEMLTPLMQNEFAASEAVKTREHDKMLTDMRIGAEREEGRANRASSSANAAADRQIQRDKMDWEKEQAQLAQTREGREALALEYSKAADSLQESAAEIYKGATSGDLDDTRYKQEIIRFTREKQKEQAARSLATAYQSGDPRKINQALYEYNVLVLGYNPQTGGR
jgi:hypothetical protein